MENIVAVMGIIVENQGAVEELNRILHEHGEQIIGRMGIPYRKKNINVISIVMDAPQERILELTCKIEKLEGVRVKTAYAKISGEE